MKLFFSIIVLSSLCSTNLYAQLYNESIDIDGQYNSGQDQSLRLEKIRRRLEKRNEIMVRKRIENARYKNELRLMKKLEQSMQKIENAIQ